MEILKLSSKFGRLIIKIYILVIEEGRTWGVCMAYSLCNLVLVWECCCIVGCQI